MKGIYDVGVPICGGSKNKMTLEGRGRTDESKREKTSEGPTTA